MKEWIETFKEIFRESGMKIVLAVVGILVFMALMMDTIVVHAAEEEVYYFEMYGEYGDITSKGFSSNARFETTDSSIVGYCVYSEYNGSSYWATIAFTSLNNTEILYGERIKCVSCQIDEINMTVSSSYGGYYSVGSTYHSISVMKNFSYSTNIMIFDSGDSLKNYIATGDDSGQINKPTLDVDSLEKDSTFTLTGFMADNTINASWTGTTNVSYETDDSFVLVRFCYFDAGETEYIYEFPLNDGGFSIPWNDVQIEGDAIKRMDVLPVGVPSDGVFGSYVKGAISSVYFSSSGEITDVFTDVTSNGGSLTSEIPTPQISVDSNGYSFGFNNAAEDYYFEMKGRWYSVEDIELYREDLMWKYKYSSIIKSELSSWVLAGNFKKATGTYSLDDLGRVAFNSFLSVYPVDDRNYYGGTNAVGNFLFGYNDALETIKMLLNQPTSIYNGVEIYVRYFTYDGAGNIQYGKWCHWYDAMGNPRGSSGSQWDDKENMFTESQSENGLTPEQMEELESTGNSKSDVDVVTSYINNTTTEIATQKIWDVMESMVASMGVFPSLVATVFGWLPSWLINMIAASIGILIILRFVGR